MATSLAALPPYVDPDRSAKTQGFQDGFAGIYTRCDCKGWFYRIAYLEGARQRRNNQTRRNRY